MTAWSLSQLGIWKCCRSEAHPLVRSASGSTQSSDRFGQMTDPTRKPAFDGPQRGIFGGRVCLRRQQTSTRSGPMSEKRTFRSFAFFDVPPASKLLIRSPFSCLASLLKESGRSPAEGGVGKIKANEGPAQQISTNQFVGIRFRCLT